MKKLSLAGVSLALVLSSAVAMADSNSFQALGEMPTAALSTMTDKQLAAVEGTFFDVDFCAGCGNFASIAQGNVSFFGVGVSQFNGAGISQEIN